MRRFRAWLVRLGGMFRKGRSDAELAAELESHVQMHIEESICAGMTPEAARRDALMRLGGVEQAKEAYREQRSLPWLDALLQDLRFSARMLRKNPGFTAVAALTLALGIGANSTIFSFADLIVRRPIALPDLNRLVAVSEIVTSTEEKGISPANYLDLKAEPHGLESLAAYQYWSAVLSWEGGSEAVTGVQVTTDFFSALGMQPLLGRTFLPDEAEPGRENAVVLSDSFWKSRFAGDRNVVGKKITLNRRVFTIVGVMPARFTFPLGAHLFWVPLAFTPKERTERSELSLGAVGRLASAATVEQTRVEMQTRWARMEKEYPDATFGRTLRVVPLLDDIVLDYNRQFALLLLGVVGFVLLIACGNVANLHLGRAAGRKQEIAIRTSLGAKRGRLLAQLVTESVLLAVVGGAVGLLLSFWGVHVLRSTLPPDVQEFCDLNELRVDFASLIFTLLLTFVAGLLAGVAPAWQQTRDYVLGALSETGARIAGGRGHRLRRVLVTGELSLAVVLLIGSGLMIKGFATLLSANPSFAPDSLVTMHVNLPPERYGESNQAKAFSDQLLSRLQSLPAVESASLASGVPYSFYDDRAAVRIAGRVELPSRQLPMVMPESVCPAYFRTMHIALREGREFDVRDVPSEAPVAIVSESMAVRLWPGESPIGRQLAVVTPNRRSGAITVVGVASDVLHEIYDHSFRSILYLPYAQAPPGSMDFVLRSQNAGPNLLALARAAVQEIDPNIPIDHLETMTQKIANQTSGLRYVARLMAFFGGVALLLAAVGVYSVVASSVNERRSEIAIRMALGAQPRDVLALVLRNEVLLTALGLGIGIGLALALTHVVAGLIYGVSSWDLTIFTGVPALLACVALLSTSIPARRAMRVDPMVVLRYE